ncbi:P-loop containing nucleoside triphosphate hydrolase protein [Mycena epipterygia]|nr:P-loop containing nucleoside triphosphate hydrolase protein [Mycena epipterygia]
MTRQVASIEGFNDPQISFSVWSDALLFPLYVGTASMITLLLHLLWSSKPILKFRATYFKTTLQDPGYTPEAQSVATHIEKHGGKTIFAFKVARLAGCLKLLVFSIFSLASDDPNAKTFAPWETDDPRKSLHAAMCATYFYVFALAILSVAGSPKWGRVAIKHLNAVLLCAFGIYFYRDVFPLATFELTPMDLSEGWLLWVKVITLFTVSGIIPVVIPRQYIPTPMPVANPEQTASILSLVFYFFLDPLIFLAYRIPHLAFDQLPPLSDSDYAENLKAVAFPHLDEFSGAKKRHVFFGIVWIYRWTFMSMAILLSFMALSAFVSPIGLNRLLNYLENSGEESFMKPWFWILLLLLGPAMSSLSRQYYTFISTRIMTQTTALITQLVFEHALRIRVKAETGDGSIADGTAGADKESSNKADANLLGKITNLVTTDLGHINEARDVVVLVVLVPIQVVGAIVFLYQVLSWRSPHFYLISTAILVVSGSFPLPGYVAKLAQTVQKETLKKTDARVQTLSAMNVIRMVKMFGWEKKMNERIADKREEELNWIWKRKLLDLINEILNYMLPILTMLVTYGSFLALHNGEFELILPQTVVAKEQLSASKVFSSMAVFDLLRTQMWTIFRYVSSAVNGKVSLDRLNEFLHNTELLDSFVSDETPDILTLDRPASDVVGFREATFAWSNEETDDRRFLLKIEEELFFKPGGVNLVVGPTGSGKTSLLMALLGEMHLVPFSPSTWYNLPRELGVSYAAQESWVMNDTIKNNILFNTPMDEMRYKTVLYQCCLEQDLGLFSSGEETEVGEKGLTLSGGQKARVTLARAIYADSQIILLDDVLAALDVHTGKWIVDKCLRGELIKDRTVILVTHNVALTSKIADFIVSVGLDGRVRSQGSISDALAKDEVLAKEVSEDRQILEAAEKEIDPLAVDELKKETDGKLIVAEEIALGHVTWSALNLYFRGMGGNHTVLFFLVFIIAIMTTEGANALQTWYLGYWARYYLVLSLTFAMADWHLTSRTALLFGSVIIYALNFIFYTLGSFRASRAIHKQLVESVLGTTLRWLDVTPTSRILARCTVDINAVDGPITSDFQALLELSITLLVRFSAIVFFTPVFFFAGALIGILGAVTGQIYIASQLSVKREMSNVKAPVLAHFGATMAGLTSIRAYGAQDALIQVSINRINRLSRAARPFANLNRWVTVRFDLLGGLFAASLGYYVVYFQSERPFNIGFSLNMAISFASIILYWVRVLNEFEVQGNRQVDSLERIQRYITVEQEPKPTSAGIPPAYWPASGSLSVDNLSAKYSPDGPKVLQDISFNIKSGERVGVVGRTGSGKSSLTLSILRCILTEGTVYYDGIPTSSLNLDALRSNITIIPQVPELLVGSLRSNLDMFGQFDDATLNNALRAAGLSSLQEDMEEGRLTLDSEIAGGGSNLSVGQRQIIALARAIVRGSKLLILDEGTPAYYKTDTVIQSSLRTELSSDTTLLTVAHRLQTIMDADKIMVLDAGRIVEFDSPKVLLRNKDGLLRALVEESGVKDALYEMARV